MLVFQPAALLNTIFIIICLCGTGSIIKICLVGLWKLMRIRKWRRLLRVLNKFLRWKAWHFKIKKPLRRNPKRLFYFI